MLRFVPPMMVRARILLILLTAIFWQGGLSADDIVDELSSVPDNDDYIDSRKPWVERDIVLPPWPREANLRELPISVASPRYRYAIDLSSLTVGGDGIIRYTIVIGPGQSNTLYEGIRCGTQQHITYAFGTGVKTFREKENRHWAPPVARGWTRYRSELMKYYFCSPGYSPLQRAEIVRRLKYAAVSDGSYDEDF